MELLSLTGEDGVPLRATVTEFGPTLLAKVLELNETQESSLALVFRYCDEKGLALIDLEDLRAALAYLTGDRQGRAEGARRHLERHRRRAAAQGLAARGRGRRRLLRRAGLRGADLLRTAPDGRGIVSVLNLADVARRPALFSTFLMWVLAELFESLPEVGDPEKPNLVFFFDEAHLLFDGASKAFLDSVAQTVRLIRSKGVGVFFITQLPTDLPDEVLSPARPPGAARRARLHPEGRPGAEGGRRDLPDDRALRPRRDAPVARRRRGGRDGARPARRADAGRGHPALPAGLAHDPAHPGGAGRGDRRVAAAAAYPTASTARAPPSCSRPAWRATRPGPTRSASRAGRPAPAPRRGGPAGEGPETVADQVGDILGSSIGKQVTREVVRGIFGMLGKKR